jgi:hypothetical protein
MTLRHVFLGEKDPKVPPAKPEDFAPTSLVKEFGESHLIDGLYKR